MSYDAVIKGGTVYDGTGSPGVVADVAIAGDTIAKIGNLDEADVAEAGTVADATAKGVAPGCITSAGHSYMSSLSDGRSRADLKEGETTQFMGDGWSMGPVTDDNKT